jgi:hypothetical protein
VGRSGSTQDPATSKDQGGAFPWLFFFCTALLAGGCEGSGGAASVRWRISVQQTGQALDPRDVSDGQGVCCEHQGSAGCAGQPGWQVEKIALVVADAVTGVPLPELADDQQLIFPCGARERTTPFILPIGTFALSLRAFASAQPLLPQASTPEPSVRVIKKGEIVNLDVIEVQVRATL